MDGAGRRATPTDARVRKPDEASVCNTDVAENVDPARESSVDQVSATAITAELPAVKTEPADDSAAPEQSAAWSPSAPQRWDPANDADGWDPAPAEHDHGTDAEPHGWTSDNADNSLTKASATTVNGAHTRTAEDTAEWSPVDDDDVEAAEQPIVVVDRSRVTRPGGEAIAAVRSRSSLAPESAIVAVERVGPAGPQAVLEPHAGGGRTTTPAGFKPAPGKAVAPNLDPPGATSY